LLSPFLARSHCLDCTSLSSVWCSLVDNGLGVFLRPGLSQSIPYGLYGMVLLCALSVPGLLCLGRLQIILGRDPNLHALSLPGLLYWTRVSVLVHTLPFSTILAPGDSTLSAQHLIVSPRIVVSCNSGGLSFIYSHGRGWSRMGSL